MNRLIKRIKTKELTIKDKNTNIKIFFFLLSIVVICLLINKIRINADVIVELNNSFSSYISEDIPSLYNLSINNDVGLSNISQVNVSFPENFIFIKDSNDTNPVIENISFANYSNKIIWIKDNLIPTGSKTNFLFNLTSNKTGIYNLTISILNSSGVYDHNFSLTVNDTTNPIIIVNNNSDSNNSAYSRDYIIYNISAYDKNNISSISLYLYNSTFALINSRKITNSSEAYGNFSGLTQGIYNLNVSVNDTKGNYNNLSFLDIILYMTSPSITLISPANNTNLNSSPIDFTFNITSGIEIEKCKLVIEEDVEKTDYAIEVNSTNKIRQVVGNGSQRWNIICEDIAGNEKQSEERVFNAFINNSNKSSGTTNVINDSNNSNQSNSLTFVNNITINSSQEYQEIKVNESEIKRGYENKLKEKEELKFNISNLTHSLKIEKVFNNNIKIILESSPQEANISIGELKKFDLTNDNFYDLSIRLNSIVNDEASLTIKEIHESKSEKNNNMLIIVIILMILTVVGALIFLFFKMKKNKEIDKKDDESDVEKTEFLQDEYAPKDQYFIDQRMIQQPFMQQQMPNQPMNNLNNSQVNNSFFSQGNKPNPNRQIY